MTDRRPCRSCLVLLAWWLPLRAHAKSQGAQDDTLARIFAAVGTTNRHFVEFGFNGRSFEEGSGANTEALYHQGWRGLLLDGRRSNATINLRTTYIKSTNIVRTFRRSGVPRELDYLSVDIDSADLWVLKAILAAYRPRVVSVEYNPHFEYDGPLAAPIAFPDPSRMPILNGRASWNMSCYFGSSAKALVMVATAGGYTLVATEQLLDLFFVRSDLWNAKRAAAAATPRPGAPYTPRPLSTGAGNGLLRGELLGERLRAASVRDPAHDPMTTSEAQNLLDYEVFVRTGSLCRARAAAAKALRAYAMAYASAAREHKHKRALVTKCFRHLTQLQALPCGASEAARPEAQQLLAERGEEFEQLGNSFG